MIEAFSFGYCLAQRQGHRTVGRPINAQNIAQKSRRPAGPVERCVKGWVLKARETLQEQCAGKPASKDDLAARVGLNEAAPSE